MEGSEYWIPAFAGMTTGVWSEAEPLSLDLSRFFWQHDRDAVADRIGEFCGPRDQFLPCCVKLQRTLGHRTDQNFQKLWIDGAFKAFGRGCHGLGLRLLVRRCSISDRHVYPSSPYREAIRSSSSSTARCLARGNGLSDRAKPTNAQYKICARAQATPGESPAALSMLST